MHTRGVLLAAFVSSLLSVGVYGGDISLQLERPLIEDYTDDDLRFLFALYSRDVLGGEEADATPVLYENFVNSVKTVLTKRLLAGSERRRMSIGLNSMAHLDVEDFRRRFSIAPSDHTSSVMQHFIKSYHPSTSNLLNSEDSSGAIKENRYAGRSPFTSVVQRRRQLSVVEEKAVEQNVHLPPTAWPQTIVEHEQCFTPVRYQHPPLVHGCGSCWTHGAVGGLEHNLCVAKQTSTPEERNTRTSFADEDAALSLPLSVQEILDCTSKDNSTSTDTGDMNNHGCNGGDSLVAWNIIMSDGLRSAAHFPGQGDHYDKDALQLCNTLKSSYTPALLPSWSSSSPSSTPSRTAPSYRLAGYEVYPNIGSMIWSNEVNSTSVWPQNMTQFDEFIKKGIREWGSVTAQILSVEDNWRVWKNWTSIYVPDADDCIGQFDAVTGELTQLTNHEVTIVGYGADETGQRFFKVKNSWTPAFGDKGYYRVATDECHQFEGPYGLGTYFKFPMVSHIQKV